MSDGINDKREEHNEIRLLRENIADMMADRDAFRASAICLQGQVDEARRERDGARDRAAAAIEERDAALLARTEWEASHGALKLLLQRREAEATNLQDRLAAADLVSQRRLETIARQRVLSCETLEARDAAHKEAIGIAVQIWRERAEEAERMVGTLRTGKPTCGGDGYNCGRTIQKLRGEVESSRLARKIEADHFAAERVALLVVAEERDAEIAQLAGARAESARRQVEPWPVGETQDTINAWQRHTFGADAPPASTALRLIKECCELQELFFGHGPPNVVDVANECADIVIFVNYLAMTCGFDVQAAINGKMATNRRRKWASDGTGHYQHVEAPE